MSAFTVNSHVGFDEKVRALLERSPASAEMVYSYPVTIRPYNSLAQCHRNPRRHGSWCLLW
jgi:hypothetical protein